MKRVWGPQKHLREAGGCNPPGTEKEHSAEKLGLVTDTLVSTEGMVRLEQAARSPDSKKLHEEQAKEEAACSR